MAEKITKTEQEIPLHEIVLQKMFEANKEKPAELSSNDVYWKVADPTINERQISEVLNWLVHERRVEKYLGNYSLDRFEFLDFKNNERIETERLETKPPVKVEKSEKPIPQVTKVIKKTPPIKESNTVESVKAVKEKRVEKSIDSKKSIDANEDVVTKKEDVAKEKISIEKEIINLKKNIIEEKPINTIENIQPKEELNVLEKVERKQQLNTFLLLLAVGFFAYTCFLLLTMSSSTRLLSSDLLAQNEINVLLSKIEQLPVRENMSEVTRLNVVDDKLDLFREIAQKRSEQLTLRAKYIMNYNLENVIKKMFFSNSVILLILVIVLYRRD